MKISYLFFFKFSFLACLNEEQFIEVLQILPFYSEFENEFGTLFKRVK